MVTINDAEVSAGLVVRRLSLALAVTLAATGVAGGSNAATPSKDSGAELRLVGKTTGRVAASAKHELNAKVDGLVEAIHFKPGQRVKKGDLLVVFVKALWVHRVESAKAVALRAAAALKQADEDVKRYAKLSRRDVVSRLKLRDARIRLDMAKADVMGAQASLAQANLSLSFHEVRAPIDGSISRTAFHPGSAVEAKVGKGRIATIVQIDPAIVRFAIPYATIARNLRQGRTQREILGNLTIRLFLPDGVAYGHSGKSIDNTFEFNPRTKMFYAFARFPNPRGLLRPGLEVAVEAWAPKQ